MTLVCEDANLLKFDQELSENLQNDFGQQNWTLGSVVPLAMFYTHTYAESLMFDQRLQSRMPENLRTNIMQKHKFDVDRTRRHHCIVLWWDKFDLNTTREEWKSLSPFRYIN